MMEAPKPNEPPPTKEKKPRKKRESKKKPQTLTIRHEPVVVSFN